MSKPKMRTVVEVCADCNATEPSWASVNRGVYMCDDCAGVHRNLGRHISQVKHLHRSVWHQNQLNMVHQLASVGSNSIWEHSLLDPAQMRGGKRKPTPNDPVHSTKNDFIRAKYEQLAFVHRPPRRDDDDLGKQLHSSVRTANLDTSLRLLSLGALANFFHSERGNTPLHVAAKAGQALQVELLVTYGADPASLDSNRLTPEGLARQEGHSELADRLVELQYELSDKLSYFVWGLVPDHKQKNHYAMPKSRDNGVGMDGRKRLQALSNQIFEELAMDVYDEIDRRESEKIWQEVKHSGGKIPPTADHVAVPFLTVNPEYSTTRNQGRQKLARFTRQEFAVLITDTLHDIIRRQSIGSGIGGFVNVQQINNGGEEDPIYDLPPDGSLDYQSIENSAARPPAKGSGVPLHEFIALKQKLVEKDEEVSKLTELNRDLSHKVTNLAKHNHELLKQRKSSGFPAETGDVASSSSKPPHSNLTTLSPRSGSTNSLIRSTFSCSANESCDGSQSSLTSVDGQQRRRTLPGGSVPDILSHSSPPDEQGNNKVTKKPPFIPNGSPHNSVGSDYDNNIPAGNPRKDSCGSNDGSRDKLTRKGDHDASNTNNNNNIVTEKLSSLPSSLVQGAPPADPGADEDANHVPDVVKQLPRADEVIRKTETVTKNIQNLLQAAQRSKIDSYLKCSENIMIAVREIVALFPACTVDENMAPILSRLGAGAQKLRNRCREVTELGLAVNSKQVTEEIIKNAYEIAKAEKELVTLTTKIQSENATSSST